MDEALPLSCSRLQFANCYGRSAVDASIHKVTQYHQRQHDSDHKAPSFGLSLNINSQVTAQMLIGIVAVEIGFTGIHVSLVPVVKVVLSSIVGHDVTSLVVVYLVFALVSFDHKVRQGEKLAMRTVWPYIGRPNLPS
ncbi:MAG: hypothetical protein RBS34_16825 [Desulfofustis sp.]|nr:hypothetical protein [Desulfofustis sp.]